MFDFDICPSCKEKVSKREGWIAIFGGKERYFHFQHLPEYRLKEVQLLGYGLPHGHKK